MALISFAATAKLICVFVFAYAKSWFSHNEACISFDRLVRILNYQLYGSETHLSEVPIYVKSRIVTSDDVMVDFEW